MSPSGTLQRLRHLLWLAGASADEHVLFGSAVLFLRGLRVEIGDVDVFVSSRVFGEWSGYAGVQVERPRAEDPRFLSFDFEPPLHAFREWSAREAWMVVEDCFRRAETVAGFRCIPLDLLADHKRQGVIDGREKDVRDLRVIERVLGIAS